MVAPVSGRCFFFAPMNRIDRIFADLRATGRKGLMPFVCAGFPTLDSTGAVLTALERAGAAIVEVGIPFSDPIADGPVIAAAMHTALTRGVTPAGVFAAVAGARPTLNIGLVAMVSISIVYRMGAARFAREAVAAGFDGVIVPDVTVDEADGALGPIREAGLTCSLLVAPTTPPQRVEQIARASTGFVYLLARLGITGTAGAAPDTTSIARGVAMLRDVTDLPIACGFGIGSPEQVRAVVSASGADAAIVGSALVTRMGQSSDPAAEAERFTRELAAGLQN